MATIMKKFDYGKGHSTLRSNRNIGKTLGILAAASAILYIVNFDTTVLSNRQASSIIGQHHHHLGKSKNVYPMKTDLFDDEVTDYLFRPESIIPEEERKPDSEIRYAAFGSSVTWGSSLDNREREAYIWKLSESDQDRGTNYAIRATGPNYVAACLSSMIGEEEYDVIILEYYMHAQEGLLTLAKRVRERFPEAIIIMTRFWGPYMILNHKTDQNLVSWAHDKGFDESFIHNDSFHKLYLREAGEDFWMWPGSKNQREAQEAAAREAGAYLVKMPFNENADGPGGWLDIGDKLLASDSFHLSAFGHEDLAVRIKEIVDRVGVRKNRRIGRDQCYNWLGSGIINDGLELGPNAKLVKMPNTEKYVVEFDNQIRHGNWILVKNESNVEMKLSVGYMTTGPPPSKYPLTEVIRDDNEKFLLTPEASSDYGEKPVHVSELASLGMIAPLANGKSISIRWTTTGNGHSVWCKLSLLLKMKMSRSHSQLLEVGR